MRFPSKCVQLCTWAHLQTLHVLSNSGVASDGALRHVHPSTSNNFIFSSLWSKSDSQLSKYCVVCEISWCRCQQLTALSISTVLVTKLSVIEQLLHPALKFARSAPWPTFQLCPSSQQILATPLLSNDPSSTIKDGWPRTLEVQVALTAGSWFYHTSVYTVTTETKFYDAC